MKEISLLGTEQMMSSLQIAEITGKNHAHVMRDIRNMANNIVKVENQSQCGLVDSDYHRGDRTQYKYLSERTQNVILNFAFGKQSSQYLVTEASYTDAKGEKRAMYSLNKKACLLLASGYDVVLRAKIIDRWEELEKANQQRVPTTFREALLLAAAQQEQIEAQQEEISMLTSKVSVLKPKADYYDSIIASPDSVKVTQIAKDYGMSPQEFNKRLNNLGIQYRVNGQWVLYAKYQGEGYTESYTGLKKNSNGTWMGTAWTQRGRLFLYTMLKEMNVLPVIERPAGYSLPPIDELRACDDEGCQIYHG